MLTEALLSASAEAVFGYLLERSGLDDKVKQTLGRDPQRLAFQLALVRAYTAFTEKHLEWTLSFFDQHFLAHEAAPILALCLHRDGPPRPEDLATAWANQMRWPHEIHLKKIAEAKDAAADFLQLLNTELRACPEFQSLFDSRAIDIIARSVEVLRAELSRDLLAAQQEIILFKLFAQAPGSLSRYIRIREFQSLVNERTKEFVGRDFVFKAIDDLLQNPNFPSGYIVISGEPGIGKTALIGELIKRKGYIHHFNIASQNIRFPRDFLGNICAQLIVRYKLNHPVLSPEATQDSGFLSQLLDEVVTKKQNQQVVILIDALDEAEDNGLDPNVNRLYLPPTLPEDIFFVVTTRDVYDYRLYVDRRENIYLRDNDPHNLENVRQYIRNFVRMHSEQMLSRIREWKVKPDDFVTIITEKSQGNFMYLVHVLRDIYTGRLTAANIDNIRNLPQGLHAYYQRHWRSMRVQDETRFEKYYQPVVCFLATAREPVSIDQVAEWAKVEPMRVKEVIQDWHEFLNKDQMEQGELVYWLYHTSFQDFLKDEVGLNHYHSIISETALGKIKW